jgi:NNP family nitrate/nitrite transporter-like MFS transporter
MFANEVVGTANAYVAGWGNLGGGCCRLAMAFLYPLFQHAFGHTDKAWRCVCLIPAGLGLLTGIVISFISDDCPKGNFRELVQHGSKEPVSGRKAIAAAATNKNSWLLFVQYACNFGVKLAMTSAAAPYVMKKYGLSPSSATSIASLFLWLNLFARALGGVFSDWCAIYWSFRGRLWAQTVLLLFEGVFVFIFAYTKTLYGSILTMIFFSLFVQAGKVEFATGENKLIHVIAKDKHPFSHIFLLTAEGTTFGIAPFIQPKFTGSVTGIVSAGGNTGAVIFVICFHYLAYQQVFVLMGSMAFVAAFLSVFIKVDGYGSLLSGKDYSIAGADDDDQDEPNDEPTQPLTSNSSPTN